MTNRMPDGPAFEAYYRRWRPLMMTLVRAKGRTWPRLRDEFESAAAVALWKISGHPDATADGFGALVVVAVRRALVNVIRSPAARHPVGLSDAAPGLVYVPDPAADRRRERVEAFDLLDVLTERERAVIRRHFWGGERFADIAPDMGVCRGQAWWVKGRAVAKLRAELAG